MNINTYVDKIFIINLDTRTDRWEQCLEQFKKYNITNYERFSAIKPNLDIKINPVINPIIYSNYNKKIIKIVGKNYIIGATGCKLSHMEIIKKSKDLGYNKILILEDDFLIRDNFNEIFKIIINKITQNINDSNDKMQEINNIINYDMLYLGGSFVKKNNNSSLTDIDGILKCNHIYTTHAYILNNTKCNNIFDTILTELKTYDKEIDVFYTEYIQKKYNVYIPYPILIEQRASYSDILHKNQNYNTKNTKQRRNINVFD